MVSLQIKEIISNTIELFKFILFFIGGMLIWSYIPWLAIILLIIISPILLYEAYKFFKEMYQSNLDDIQEQLNIVQDTWIEDISNEVRNNWDLNTNIVVPYVNWDCRIYIQQDENGNVLNTEIQECSISDKRRANRIKKSLVRAVLKTSPLPRPDDTTVFTRQVYFDFSKT
jgi:divalent metal cation (Fe/Co/Zn/Cd) transporter